MVWPVWALVLVVGPMLVLCALAWWRARRTRDGTERAWLRRTGMVLATLAIGLAPAVPTETETVETNAEVFFVVDRTGSMAAEDYNGDQARLEGVRHDIVAVMEALPGARYSVIGFDSQATRQLPLTTDSRAVRSWAETLRQEITWYSAGSTIDRPAATLTQTLEAAAERNPANVRLVFFLSDGENTDGDNSSATPQEGAYAHLDPLVDGGAVLGYGTAEGGRMRSYDGTDASGPGTDAPWITDETQPGAPPAVSRIDETNLRRLAEDLGVEYVHRIEPGPVDQLVAGIDVEELAADGRREIDTFRDVYWPAAALLALLTAWEAFELAARWRRLREVAA
ncbi:VWA domain-containing protein [Georgenia sp. EYE_87]|uniref:vWA domain-containing protein n=1 Tax=Georgenia sp. EYE_87 TaxID=2853448 RepID=UPI00200337EE|nr:VWA domain-containing protein [Georgenia sp. EYE_87]MCK6211293.1 VWA domain-containing protein [Georgenia sp. EYE_87]